MKPSTLLELDRPQLDALLQRIEPVLIGADYRMLKALVDTFLFTTQWLQSKNASIQRLRKMLFGAPTEKTRKVLKNALQQEAGCGQQSDPASGTPQPGAVAPEKPAKPRPGHGRNGAQDYPGANKVQLEHPSLNSSDLCPQCEQGKVYAMAPGVLMRITGQAPLQATVYEFQKLRCNLCGEIYTAPRPAGIHPQKYDARAASMIALLKYGSGQPFYRSQRLQDGLGMPLPASTQWQVVAAAASLIKPAYQELIRQAAQGDVLYNDDTTNKVLALMKENTINQELALSSTTGDPPRTGIFTTGIVSTFQKHTIALFFTGRQHAGENLAQLKKLGFATVAYFVLTTAVAAALGLWIAELIQPGIAVGEVMQTAARAATAAQQAQFEAPAWRELPQHLVALLPGNPLNSMVQGEMLQVVIFAAVVGVALLSMSPDSAKPMLDVLGSLQEVCMTVVRWAMMLAPFAVFGLMARLTSQVGVEALLGMGLYMLTVLLGLLVLLTMNGHLMILATLAKSFEMLPIGLD